MAAIIIYMAMAFMLRRASADLYTTTFFLPNALFVPTPMPQTFLAESSIISGTSYYTLDCGGYNQPFWGGNYGCDWNNSYTFSAIPATTRFLMPK